MAVRLSEWQRIPTSGVRAVEPFTVAGLDLLAIPQLARDVLTRKSGHNELVRKFVAAGLFPAR
jgi:EPTP domain